MYQRKVDVDMLNAVKSVLADVSSVSPSSEQDFPLIRGIRPYSSIVYTIRYISIRYSLEF